MTNSPKKISPYMTVLDIVSDNREAIEVFKSYDEQAGECICCTSLFNTLEEVAKKYHIILHTILIDLEKASGAD